VSSRARGEEVRKHALPTISILILASMLVEEEGSMDGATRIVLRSTTTCSDVSQAQLLWERKRR
jgi:hypothetical protein